MAPSKECNSNSVSTVEPPPSSRAGCSAPDSQPHAAKAQTGKVKEDPHAARKCLNNLVSKVITLAESYPTILSSEKIVIEHIICDMRKTPHDFIIWDLKDRHYKKIADLFGCPIPEVKTEFDRLLKLHDAENSKDAKPEKIYEFEYSTSDSTPPPILKLPNSRQKNLRVSIPRQAILDDLVYKEVNRAKKLWKRPKKKNPKWTERETVIDRILQNMANNDFTIDELKDYHHQKVSNFYGCQESSVKEEFSQQNNGVEKEEEKPFDLAHLISELLKTDPLEIKSDNQLIRLFVMNLEWFGFTLSGLKREDYKKFANFMVLETSTVKAKFYEMRMKLVEELEEEERSKKLEEMLNDLISGEIQIAKFGKGKIEPNTLTKRQFMTRFRDKIELQCLTPFLQPRHFAVIAKFYKCEALEIENDFFELQETPEPENEEPPPTLLRKRKYSNRNSAQRQKNHQEEPLAKRQKIVSEPE